MRRGINVRGGGLEGEVGQKDEGMKKKGGHAETVSFKQFFLWAQLLDHRRMPYITICKS